MVKIDLMEIVEYSIKSSVPFVKINELFQKEGWKPNPYSIEEKFFNTSPVIASAWINMNLVGFGRVSNMLRPHSLTITDLIVDPEMRNLKIATKLVRILEREAKKYSCKILYADTHDNYAKQIFIKSNFKETQGFNIHEPLNVFYLKEL